jgi:hypothetical protein
MKSPGSREREQPILTQKPVEIDTATAPAEPESRAAPFVPTALCERTQQQEF